MKGIFPFRGVTGPDVWAVLGAAPLGKQGGFVPCGAGPLVGAGTAGCWAEPATDGGFETLHRHQIFQTEVKCFEARDWDLKGKCPITILECHFFPLENPLLG